LKQNKETRGVAELKEMLTASGKNGMVWRRLTAAVVALWLTGAGCLICCGETTQTAAPHRDAIVVGGAPASGAAPAARQSPAPRAAMGADHSCCKARVPVRSAVARKPRAVQRPPADAPVTNSTAASDSIGSGAAALGRRVAFPERPSRARVCCERTAQTLDAARKPRRDDAPQSVISTPAGYFAGAAAPARAHAPLPDRRTRLPDRGDARLLACVFLI
jgi:hypothetical protein